MSTISTVQSITDNVATILKALSLNVEYDTTVDFGNLPKSNNDFVRLIWLREIPEYTRGQRQSYRETFFELQIIIEERNKQELNRKLQQRVHEVINGLTVDALNIGDLVSTKLITLVEVSQNDDFDYRDTRAMISLELMVRYRDDDT